MKRTYPFYPSIRFISYFLELRKIKMLIKKFLCGFFVFYLIPVLSSAGIQDWSQWRGPQRDGSARNFAVPEKWPAALQTIWSIEVGTGHSSPVILDEIVYLFSREAENEIARAIDLKSGKILWRTGYSAPYKEYPGAVEHGKGPKSTPVVFAGKLFTLGISGILTCFSTSNGKLLWQKDFSGRFPANHPPFGTSMSPLIEDGMLIVHAGGHQGGALLALDPDKGLEKWSLAGEGPSYSSPIVITLEKQKQIVIQVHRKILGVNLQNGKILWSIPFATPCDQNIVTPVLANNILIFSSLDKGTFGVRLHHDGQNWTPEILWDTKDVSLYMSSPVLAGNRLIGFSHKRQGEFFALDPASGKVIWKSGARIAENAALVTTGSDILILKEDAELFVLPATVDSFQPVATYQVAKSATWAHPVPTSQGILIKDALSLSLLRY
ncbi:PQQ-like beta-propeller repeat protein [bacterium]|nr:PQQ-like beta-propeller repeat protein [bacterium]